jgi:hypothetical protein
MVTILVIGSILAAALLMTEVAGRDGTEAVSAKAASTSALP